MTLLEYEDAVLWYYLRSPKDSKNFVAEFNRKINILKENPIQYPIKHKERREILLNKYPYSILYVVDEKKKVTFITSIFRHKRSPSKKYR